MGNFFRWSQPAWSGITVNPSTAVATALANGHNYLFFNVTSGGAGPSASPVDVQVSEGSYQHTFFVSAGEDATAKSVNRGLKALALNTDLLDEIVNEDRLVLRKLAVTISPGSLDTFTLPAGVYLGPSGDPITSDTLLELMRLVTEEGDEVVIGGTLVVAQGCSEGSSTVYSAGTETITLNLEVPAGTYYILCYKWNRISYLGEDLWKPAILASQVRVSGVVAGMFQLLKGDGASWDGAPNTDLRILTRLGLQGIYAHSTSVTATPSWLFPYYGTASVDDTPGAGGVFTRSGPAMAGFSQTDVQTGSVLRDPLGAIWLAYGQDTHPGDGAAINKFLAGTRSFVSILPGIRSTDAGSSSNAPGLAHFVAYSEHLDSSSNEALLKTKITFGAAANIQQVLGEDLLTLNTGGDDWFTKTISGTTYTALVVGHTLIEVEWANPSDLYTTSTTRRMYRVQAVVSSNQVKLMGLDGSAIGFPAGLTAATIRRVLSPTFIAPAGAGERQTFQGHPYASVLERGPLMSLVLPGTSLEAADAVSPDAPYFGASADTSAAYAFTWGGFQGNMAGPTPGRYRSLASLRGDGSIWPTNVASPLGTITTLSSTTATLVNATITNATVATSTVTTFTAELADMEVANIDYLLLRRLQYDTTQITVGGTQTANVASLFSTKQMVRVKFSGTAIVTTISLPTFPVGSVYELWFDHQSGTGQIQSYSTTWPSNVYFESEADKLLTCESGYIDIYKLVVVEVGKISATVTRRKVA